MIKFYHNAMCSKSREPKAILDSYKIKYETVEYLVTGLKKDELLSLARKLELKPSQFIRKGEKEFEGLENFSEDELIDAMVQHPKLLQRPIVVVEGSAIIGRPPENILKVLPPP